MKQDGILVLTRSEIKPLLTLAEYIDVVADAFRQHATGQTLAPGLLHVDADAGEFHIKAGGLKGDRTFFALKANGGFFQNQARFGLPNIQGVIILFDGDNGRPLALMDSIEITIQRTGAAGAVAARYLARPDSEVATICGCGNQGRVQLRALKEVLPDLRQVYAFDASPDSAARFAVEMAGELDLAVSPVENLGAATLSSDVVVTCTPARKPFLKRAHIRPGTLVSAIGADSPDKQELDPALLAGNRVVADILAQCIEVGELHHALAAGLITEHDIHGELGQIIAGDVPGRTAADEIFIFDATGTALQDAAAAVAVYSKALASGIGVTVDLLR